MPSQPHRPPSAAPRSSPHCARAPLGEARREIGLVAKLERVEAVANEAALDGIIEATEAMMVAHDDHVNAHGGTNTLKTLEA